MSGRIQRPRRGQGGFTLIEVLISLSILAFMMTVTWSVTTQVVSSKKHFEVVEDRYHELRVGTTRMVHDLSMAYISVNEDINDPDRRTFFIGKTSGQVDELRFSSFAHQSLFADADESEQTMIAYYSAPDPYDPASTNLVRRESRRMTNEKWDSESGDVDVLIHGVEEVRFEYWDWRNQEWKTDWDSTAVDAQRGHVPPRVRIEVTVDDNNKPMKFITEARLLMEEELRFVTN